MNSKEIFALIEQIAATPSKLDKQALVKVGMQDDDFSKVIRYALDPFIRFGIKNISITNHADQDEVFGAGDNSIYSLLDAIHSREITGNSARVAVDATFQTLSLDSAILLHRIITKDLRAGFDCTTVNKVSKGFFKEFPYMRCSLKSKVNLDEWKWSDGIYVQEKADGLFANLTVVEESGDINVSMTTRAGNDFPMEHFFDIAGVAVVSFRNVQLHGEILVVVDDVIAPREIGNGIINSVLKGGSFTGTQRPVFCVWDCVPIECAVPGGEYDEPYRNRLLKVITSIKSLDAISDINALQPHIITIPTHLVNSIDDAYGVYGDYLASGKEGVVLKRPDAIWEDRTSKGQVKLKLQVDFEVVVCGYNPGKGKHTKTFGSLICRSEDHLLEVSVSGFSDKQRKEIWENMDDWAGSIITIRANGVMVSTDERKLHSAFLPRFVERRDDKSVADTYQQILDQFEAAKKL